MIAYIQVNLKPNFESNEKGKNDNKRISTSTTFFKNIVKFSPF